MKEPDRLMIIRMSIAVAGVAVLVAAAAHPQPDVEPAPETLPLACLRRAYGDYIKGNTADPGGTGAPRSVWVMKNGSRIPVDDGRVKSPKELLDAPDLLDQFAYLYPVGEWSGPAKKDADPGRVRVSSFFDAIYGESEKAVRQGLVSVKWPVAKGVRNLRFHRNAGAADALKRVADGISALSPRGRAVMQGVGGTFNYRKIAGTHRLSAHAYGIAIDVDVKRSAYWRWSRTFPEFVNNIPLEVVSLFEQNGFIWGGKWYHFDTMHFEYRPEILCAAGAGGATRSSH